jgi:hypothetical protein
MSTLLAQLDARRRMLVTATGQLDAARRSPGVPDRNLIARLETLIADHRRTIADLERALARESGRP